MVLFKARRPEPVKISQDDMVDSMHVRGGEGLKGMCM